MPRPNLILASRSPRRRELLSEAGYEFAVRPPSREDESTLRAGETVSELVQRLAIEKALDVAEQFAADVESARGRSGNERPGPDGSGDPPSDRIVLACDTVAECEGHVLGKPESEADARRMLRLLSGRLHHVLSGVCLLRVPGGQPIVRVAVTTLQMDQLSQRQLDEYLAGGQWEGKAGAFGYQDQLGWVHVIEGSESNVVGLPLELLAEMLKELNC